MAGSAIQTPTVEGRARPVHTRTEVLGLALLGAAPLFVLLAALVAGLPLGDGAFLAIPITASVLGVVLAWRFGTWAKAVALLLGLLGGMMVFWLVFGLFEPSSFVDFTGGVTWTVGLLLTLGGGIAALVHRNDLQVEATHAEQVVERAALSVVGVAVIASLGLWLLARESVPADLASGATEVRAHNFEYPVAVEITSGDSLVVRNSDPFHHTFTIDELDIDVELVGGSSVLVPIDGAAGTYTFYCVPHTDKSDGIDEDHDMAGTLTIR